MKCEVLIPMLEKEEGWEGPGGWKRSVELQAGKKECVYFG